MKHDRTAWTSLPLPPSPSRARIRGVNISSIDARRRTPSFAAVPPMRNASHLAMSPSGAFNPPFDTVMPLSKSNRCSVMPSSVPV
jgi:hypothetical protein